jgi:hypothetical protein
VGRRRKTLKERAREAFTRAGPDPGGLRTLFGLPEQDWNDERVRAIVANVALTLSDEPADGPLRAAFKAAKLDPRDPLHWRRLLDIFAEIHFSSPVRRGAPRKWDFEQFDRHIELARAKTKKNSQPTW